MHLQYPKIKPTCHMCLRDFVAKFFVSLVHQSFLGGVKNRNLNQKKMEIKTGKTKTNEKLRVQFLYFKETKVPNFSDREDQVLWSKRDGNSHTFSVKLVWENIHPRGQEVDWFRVVWHTSWKGEQL